MSTTFNLNAADQSKVQVIPPEPVATARRRAFWELVVGYGLVHGALWSEGDARWGWAVAAAVWIVGLTIYHRATLREVGLGVTGLRRSLWVAAAAVVTGAAMLFGAHLAGTLHPYVLHRTLAAAAFGYLIWTFQQQFMLQSFFFLRLEQLLGSRGAVWAAAALFAVAHIPNPVLVPATLVAGLVFCELFRRYRNIYVLAIGQAILGMCLAAAVPSSLHHHMRVGIGYLTWITR
jgi:membrane protease YdiL (CAAX protease family)